MGWRSVRDCAEALRSCEGATTVTSPIGVTAWTSARRPAAWMPSSLVTRIRGLFELSGMEISARAKHLSKFFKNYRERKMVGTTGFEPATSRTPSVRATRLRYVPTAFDSNQRITRVREGSRQREVLRANRGGICVARARVARDERFVPARSYDLHLLRQLRRSLFHFRRPDRRDVFGRRRW